MYEVTIDDEPPTLIGASALVEAWEESVPDLAARVLELPVGGVAKLMDMPLITVHRIW